MSPHPGQKWLSSKNAYATNAGEGMENREISYMVGMYIGIDTMENSMEDPLNNKIRATICPINPTPGHISREKHVPKWYMHADVHFRTVYKNRDVEVI